MRNSSNQAQLKKTTNKLESQSNNFAELEHEESLNKNQQILDEKLMNQAI